MLQSGTTAVLLLSGTVLAGGPVHVLGLCPAAGMCGGFFTLDGGCKGAAVGVGTEGGKLFPSVDLDDGCGKLLLVETGCRGGCTKLLETPLLSCVLLLL